MTSRCGLKWTPSAGCLGRLLSSSSNSRPGAPFVERSIRGASSESSLPSLRMRRLARELRRHDIVVELGDETFRLKKSLETASKMGAKYALIAGENELSTGVLALKNLATGEQKAVPRNLLAQVIQS